MENPRRAGISRIVSNLFDLFSAIQDGNWVIQDINRLIERTLLLNDNLL